jgi:cytochrome c-type biogenesis protein CcmH/NrfF
MTDPKTAERQRKMEQLMTFIGQQLAQGNSEQDVVNTLVAKGVPQNIAADLVAKNVSNQGAKQAAPPQPSTPAFQPPAPQQRPPASRPPPVPTQGSFNNKNITEYIEQQIAQGQSQQELVNALVAQGVSQNEAIDRVVKASRMQQAAIAPPPKETRKEQASKGARKMLIGIACLVGGGLITAASYAAAEPGETFILFYGLIIYGLVYTVWGIIEWVSNM